MKKIVTSLTALAVAAGIAVGGAHAADVQGDRKSVV